MSWAIGYDEKWKRWIGYGVPATCDHPECVEKIDRGLAHVCCDSQPYGGNKGCGLYFCNKHADWRGRCEACRHQRAPFTPKPEHQEWISHVLTDDSWRPWCEQNPQAAQAMREQLRFTAVAN